MLTWIAILILAALSALAFLMGRRKALGSAGGSPAMMHSLPGYYGTYVALWVGVPAALLLFASIGFGGRIEHALLTANQPPILHQLSVEQKELFFQDAQALAEGRQLSEAVYEPNMKVALDAKANEARGYSNVFNQGTLALMAVLVLAGFLWTFPRLNKDVRARNRVEGWVDGLLMACSIVAVITTLGIILSLVWESSRFFSAVSPAEFLLGTHWSPQIGMRDDQVGSSGGFGALPLFAGTFLVMLIAMCVAGPVGLFSAIYLSEYAGPKARAVFKPLLEILAGVPTVVYGFFAALTVGPIFRQGFNSLGGLFLGGPMNELGLYLGQVQNQMALVAGVVMGIMLIPFVSSLSDDIINSVPQALRDGSYAMGATKSETVKNVVLPAALPGIAAAFLLAISRAIGETMIVTMAAGLQAKLTLNPLETVTTVTVQIVTLLTGDQEFDSPKTLAAFGLGLTLFAVTLGLNIVALRIVQKYREQYD